MKIDSELVRSERRRRAWSQGHLAGACGLGRRTIQRAERDGKASYETVQALAAALEVPLSQLFEAPAIEARPPAGAHADDNRQARRPARPSRYAQWSGAAIVFAVVAIGAAMLYEPKPDVTVAPEASAALELSPMLTFNDAVTYFANDAIDANWAERANRLLGIMVNRKLALQQESGVEQFVDCRSTSCYVRIEYPDDAERNHSRINSVMTERPMLRGALGFSIVRWRFTEPASLGDPLTAELVFVGERTQLARALDEGNALREIMRAVREPWPSGSQRIEQRRNVRFSSGFRLPSDGV